eukprot:jgi/Botrbrau1/19125/Bobra.0077s0037.1
MSQAIALGCLNKGDSYLKERLATLQDNRGALLDALKPLGDLGKGVWGGDAIYFWAALPPGCEDDRPIVKWMLHKHRVIVIPGSACGCPGYIRVAFGKPAPGEIAENIARLKAALSELVLSGPAAAKEWLAAHVTE